MAGLAPPAGGSMPACRHAGATLAVVIPAAGEARRMGRCKAVLPLGTGPCALERLASLWHGLARPLVVTGFHAPAVETACTAAGLATVRNAAPAEGMFSSIRAGLAAVLRQTPEVTGIFVHPVDVPLVRPLTVQALLAAARESDESVLLPVFAGEEGHPVFLPASVARQVLSFQGEGGLRAALRPFAVRRVPVADACMLHDMDTPQDHATLSALADRMDRLQPREALELLRLHDVPERGIRHGLAVGHVARALCRALSAARARQSQAASLPALDGDLALVCGMVHDICKGQPDHECAGGHRLAELGLERMGGIIATHRDMAPVPAGRMTEQELVFLADKYCRGSMWVSVAQRFADKLRIHAADAAACAAIMGRRDRALRMEAALAAGLREGGEETPPAEIARQAVAEAEQVLAADIALSAGGLKDMA